MSLDIGTDHLSEDELRELKEALTRLVGYFYLTNWEVGFAEDMLTRLETYGVRTTISDHQRETINELRTHYLGYGTAALPFD